MTARLPENARSEWVAPNTFPVGGVVESMRMFHAACAASHRPALRPTRGSGVGVVEDTMGSTGFGMTAGGGGGGGGGVPRPPRPASAAPAAGIAAAGVVAGADGAAAAAGAVGVGAAAGGGVAGVVAGGGALGALAGAAPFVEELAHAGDPSAAVPIRTANRPPMESVLMAVDSPASRACDRSRSIDRRKRQTRT